VEDLKTDFVTVVIWDKDPIGKDFLGMTSIPICLADHRKEPLDVWVRKEKEGNFAPFFVSL
jgi:hypothetical protein